MTSRFLFLISVFFLFIFGDIKADVKLPNIFQSHMVLQRDRTIAVWGWADPNEIVTVMLNGRSVSVKTNRQGKWRGELPALTAGGPYELIIQGNNKVVISDVLIGDVWICGGQSNMQWSVSQTGYKEADTSFIHHANVRLFTVQVDMDYTPKEDVKSNGWKQLSKEDIDAFSAVAYHFGRYLHRNLDIPIGLISDNLGATAIETWMSNEALLQFPQFKTLIGPIVKERKNFEQLQASFEKGKSQWYKHYLKGIGMEQEWFLPETNLSDWKPIKASGNTWENEQDLVQHKGAVWFRTTFDLPEKYDQKTFMISLLQIDDYDIAWVNGKKIGETYGRHNHRNYSVPVEYLKEKDNVLVVRVYNLNGIGGFTTSPFWGNPVLWGNWLYKKGESVLDNVEQPNLPNVTPFSSPGVLYNANIAPLTTFPIKGVIWYQGESNVDRAYEYRELFPAMILDWRKQWKQPDLPFLFVQLANYEKESDTPAQNNWAELREAQSMALSLPHTGMATAIDVGEANDIHPKNKLTVGTRLGLAAMKVAYHRDSIISGPTFKSMKVVGDHVIVEYENAGEGLVSKDKYGYIRGFQMAGEDQKFYWAQAKIDGSSVVVNCPQVRNPVAIRYAWENNPGKVDLYNRNGLPAVPFRTDSWKGITAGAVFQDMVRF